MLFLDNVITSFTLLHSELEHGLIILCLENVYIHVHHFNSNSLVGSCCVCVQEWTAAEANQSWVFVVAGTTLIAVYVWLLLI